MSWFTAIRDRILPKPAPPPPIILSRAPRIPGGRVSWDSTNSFPSASWIVAPPADYESNWQLMRIDARRLDCYSPVQLMEMLADLSPEVSKALWDFLRLCNPGWEVKALRPGGDTEDDRAKVALDAYLATLADIYGTVDIVIGRLFMGPFLRGALCGEMILDKRGRLPIDFATPDPASIRFRIRSDPERGQVWQPGQWQNGQFVPLDIPTFRYLPIDPMPSSPYGRPLAAPALFTSLFLLGIMHDLKRVIQQQGYPRLDLSINTLELIKAAPNVASSQEVFDTWSAALVASVQDSFSQLQPDDTYIHTDLVTMNRPVGTVDASSLGGINAVIVALERMAVRALKTMPLMMGITDSVGDVQSNRQWEIYAAGIKSIQHYTETMLERLLGLALEAQGIQATVQFRLAELRAAEMLRDAQTEAMQIANEKAKYEQGWTSQDEGSETITGHPADVPEPRTAAPAAPQTPGDNNDGQEQVSRGNRGTPVEKRVKLIPDGAEDPLIPVPEEVTISDTDIEQALDDWDALMPDYVGLLDATVVGQAHFDTADGRGNDAWARVVRIVADAQIVSIRQRNPSIWSYDQASHRYRNTSTGRYIGQSTMVGLRDQFIESKKAAGDDLAGRLSRGEVSIQQWELEFRKQVKTAFVDEFVLGKGGRNAMTQSDWGAVGRMIRDQYTFSHEFARDIADGELSLAQIEARGRLYMDSATQAYERGRGASFGGLSLPEYPADGNQICKSNCRCSWVIEETDTEWRCTWQLSSGGETCDTCLGNAEKWNPLVITKDGRSRAQVERYLEGMRNGHH